MPGAGYEQQVEMLRRIRGGVADCDAARKRVELRMTSLAESSGELERRADEVRAARQPDLAQESLARKNAVEAELGELRDQYQSLRQQKDRPRARSALRLLPAAAPAGLAASTSRLARLMLSCLAWPPLLTFVIAGR